MAPIEPQVIDLGDYIVGETPVISVRETSDGASVTLVKARYVGMDPDRSTAATAYSGGTGRFKTLSQTQADSFWNNCPVEISQATIVWKTEVLAYTSDASTGLFTITPIGAAVASGNAINFPAYPVMPLCTGTLSGGKGSVTAYPSGTNEYTAYAGERRLLGLYSTATDIRRFVGVHNIVETL